MFRIIKLNPQQIEDYSYLFILSLQRNFQHSEACRLSLAFSDYIIPIIQLMRYYTIVNYTQVHSKATV